MHSHYVVYRGEDFHCSQAVDEILARRGFLKFALRRKTTEPPPPQNTNSDDDDERWPRDESTAPQVRD
jgi:hypothetical protein